MADGTGNLPEAISLLYAGVGAFFTALAAIVTGAMRGRWFSSPPPPPAAHIPNEQIYFWDGPMGEALKLLRDHRNIANETREHIAPLGEQMRNMNKELSEIKGQLASLKDIKMRGR